MKRIVWVLAVGACSYPVETYREELVSASCELAVSCGTWGDVAACAAAAELPSHPGCTYDASAAGDCVDAVRLSSCAADGTLSDLPECQAVWACP